jgi:hypothetical protein
MRGTDAFMREESQAWRSSPRNRLAGIDLAPLMRPVFVHSDGRAGQFWRSGQRRKPLSQLGAWSFLTGGPRWVKLTI